MPPLEKRNVRLPRLALVVRLLFAFFLFGTGIMTMGFATRGYPVSDAPDEVGQFMIALENTGYLIYWVGLFKTVAGGLMFDVLPADRASRCSDVAALCLQYPAVRDLFRAPIPRHRASRLCGLRVSPLLLL